MIVRSNIITRATIGAAVGAVPGIGFQDTRSREGWYEPIREFKPRSFEYGFEFFLKGSSSYRARHSEEFAAATWTEWGIVIAKLYEVDPNAQIGSYHNRRDFMEKTALAGWKSDTDKPWLKRLPLNVHVASETPKNDPARFEMVAV